MIVQELLKRFGLDVDGQSELAALRARVEALEEEHDEPQLCPLCGAADGECPDNAQVLEVDSVDGIAVLSWNEEVGVLSDGKKKCKDRTAFLLLRDGPVLLKSK